MELTKFRNDEFKNEAKRRSKYFCAKPIKYIQGVQYSGMPPELVLFLTTFINENCL